MDHSTERHDRSVTPPRAVVLRVLAGPDTGSERTLFPSDKLLVGTSQSCALKLGDRRVSRRHLALEQTPEGLLVRDLGSTNGTFVRGVRVREAYVVPGDTIEIGDSQLATTDVDAPADAAPPEADSFGRMVGRSIEMRRLFALADKLAKAEMHVLIEGETGTGKELLAEELHARSVRAQGPLVTFSALAEDPHASAALLFGAAPGMLPSAPDGKAGLLEQAQGGTLILDEPSELTPDIQRRLAGALARGEAQRVGGAAFKLDVRILTTTNANLDRAVERGLFREDLFFALAAARVEIAPVRRRAADIAVLARHFWAAAHGTGDVPSSLVAHLEAYPWPGNVRELENAVARHLATGELDVGARSKSLPPEADKTDVVAEVLAKRLPLVQARQEVVVRFEQAYVDQILREHNGNVTRAARASGLAHRYFQALKARRQK